MADVDLYHITKFSPDFRLLFIASTQKRVVYVSFNDRNHSGLFLSHYFLFWEILNLRLAFAVCSERES